MRDYRAATTAAAVDPDRGGDDDGGVAHRQPATSGGGGGGDGRGRNARVRIIRNGGIITREGKSGSKADRENYSNLRRLWKYPPSLLRLGAVVASVVVCFWIGFGIYGMYTFFHQVVYFDRGTTALPPKINRHNNVFHPVQDGYHQQHQQQHYYYQQPYHQEHNHEHIDNGRRLSNEHRQRHDESPRNYNPNEIVIRIVKEVVHVREDGSRIENYEQSSEEDVFDNEFVEEIRDRVARSIQNSDGTTPSQAGSTGAGGGGAEDADPRAAAAASCDSQQNVQDEDGSTVADHLADTEL